MIVVSIDHDPSTDFSLLKTYKWLSDPVAQTGNSRLDNPLLAKRIKKIVEEELGKKGYKEETSGKADFLLGYHIALENKISVTQMNDYYGYGPGWGRGYGYYGGVGNYVYQYEEGTLILDIVSPTIKLLWRGTAQAEVYRGDDLKSKNKLIRDAVSKMLGDFPPKSN